MDSKIGFEMSLFVVDAICANFMIWEMCGGQTIIDKLRPLKNNNCNTLILKSFYKNKARSEPTTITLQARGSNRCTTEARSLATKGIQFGNKQIT